MGNLQYIAYPQPREAAPPTLASTHKNGDSGYSGSTSSPSLPILRLCFSAEAVFSILPNHVPLAFRSPRVLLAAGVGAATAIGIASYMMTRRKPSAEEVERERRELLARVGRITDGTIMDTLMREIAADAANNSGSNDLSAAPETHSAGYAPDPDADPSTAPHIIIYNYRIAGVSYECAQDVTSLADYVHGVRTDLPIQVRYAPHNPGNSIVVAETWSGLRLIGTHSVPRNLPSSSPTD